MIFRPEQLRNFRVSERAELRETGNYGIQSGNPKMGCMGLKFVEVIHHPSGGIQH